MKINSRMCASILSDHRSGKYLHRSCSIRWRQRARGVSANYIKTETATWAKSFASRSGGGKGWRVAKVNRRKYGHGGEGYVFVFAIRYGIPHFRASIACHRYAALLIANRRMQHLLAAAVRFRRFRKRNR